MTFPRFDGYQIDRGSGVHQTGGRSDPRRQEMQPESEGWQQFLLAASAVKPSQKAAN